MDDFERFWSKVKQQGDCWSWTGATQSRGYGAFGVRIDNKRWKTILAHRKAYKMLKGEIPSWLNVDHLCRNKRCVNPNHLELVTPGDNLLRSYTCKLYCGEGHMIQNPYVSESRHWCRAYSKKRANAAHKGVIYVTSKQNSRHI